MNVSCRHKNAEQIFEMLSGELAGSQFNLGYLAHKLNRGIAYVHSLVREDQRFDVETYPRRTRTGRVVHSEVSNFTITLRTSAVGPSRPPAA